MTRIRSAAFVVLMSGLMLVLIEGLAGVLVVGHSAWEVLQPFDERVHTRYDSELGWVGIPNFNQPDIYGSGEGVSTDARGFRIATPLPQTIAPGHLRVICSGDSFTFGVGVGDAETWCHRLTSLDPRLESINMGQIGYGVDQAYLWYRRDGTRIAHHVQVLAVISADFDRMRFSSFMSYGKPMLALDGDALAVRNTPVPNRSATSVRFQRVTWALKTSRTAQVLRSLLAHPTTQTGDHPRKPLEDLRPVVARLFQALHELHAQQGTTLVVAFLPVRSDYDDSRSDAWRGLVRETTGGQIPLVDLVEEFRALPAEEVDAHFIGPDESPYGLAEGHYSIRGHDFVARSISRTIARLDATKIGSGQDVRPR